MASAAPDLNELALTADDTALLAQLRPKLEDADLKRQEKYAEYRRRRNIALIAALVVAPLIVWLFVLYGNVALVWLVALFGGGMYHWMTVPKRAYRNIYKQSVLPRIAAAYGLDYQMDGRIPDRELRVSGLLPSYDSYRSEDYFSGTYKGAQLRCAEIVLTETRGSGKRRRTVTVFKGLAVIIALPRVRFYGHTIVVKNAIKLAEWMRETFGGLKRADLVDPVFEKTYSVFTNDQVEARYLLHPAMIERINTLDHAHAGAASALSIAYRDGCVFMLLPSHKNMFEPAGIDVPATDRAAVLSLRSHLSGVLGMIDQLEFYQPPAQK